MLGVENLFGLSLQHFLCSGLFCIFLSSFFKSVNLKSPFNEKSIFFGFCGLFILNLSFMSFSFSVSLLQMQVFLSIVLYFISALDLTNQFHDEKGFSQYRVYFLMFFLFLLELS